MENIKVPVSPGEVLDKITILEIKSERMEDPEKVANVRIELKLLQDTWAENIHLLNAPFLWMVDLSRPDSLFLLPFRLPFFGAEFNLLPFLMTAISVAASALHQPETQSPELRRKHVINMTLMAVLFFALFYTFPAGMVLYWTTNNLISVTKSLWARR